MILVSTGCFGGCTVEDDESTGMTFPVTMTAEATDEVAIDAYYTYYEELPYFYFNIEFENTTSEDMEITYVWTLNYPPWNFLYGDSRDYLLNQTHARIYEGEGNVSLTAMGTNDAVIKIQKIKDSHFNYSGDYTMHVAVYCGDELVGYYFQRKSPSKWDYNVTPPVQTVFE